MNYVKQYIEEIESGRILVNKKIRKVYCEIIKPIIEDKDPKYYFDEARGEHVIKFLEKFCIQSKGKWRGKRLSLLLFQKAKWQTVFGVLSRATHLRRFKEIFDVRGRKNCKTTEHAGIALYLLMEEEGAEIYAAAQTYAQAKRLWNEAKSMVNFNPKLTGNKSPTKGRIGHGPYLYRSFPESDIYIQAKDSHFKALTSNVDALDGLNASAAVIDEVHALGREIYDLLKQSMTVREQPLVSMISTAGFIRGGLYDDIYDYAMQILNGIVEDDTFLPIIYDLDDPKDIYNEDYWVHANPAIDAVKSREDLRTLVKRMATERNLENTVKVKDFNIRGVENKAWLPFEVFNNEEVYSKEQLDDLKYMAIGGLDLSRTGDMTAFTTTYVDSANNKVISETMYWVTEDFLESETEMNSKVPWKAWIDRGLIRISGTNHIEYKDISNYVLERFNEGVTYVYIGYDSYSATYLVDELIGMGYSPGNCLIPVIQGFKSLSIPMQTLENDLIDKKFIYQNNPVTKWCFSNVELVQDRNGNYMPRKILENKKRKIDGVATIIDTYYCLTQNMQVFS